METDRERLVEIARRFDEVTAYLREQPENPDEDA